MIEGYPKHPVTYRQEIAETLFGLLKVGESCNIVGAASVAKSNLLRFLGRADVQHYYLGADGRRIWLVSVDTNRLASFSDWASYELMLHCLVMESERQEDTGDRIQQLSALHRQVVESESLLLAQRYLERAARLVCEEYGVQLVFVIDEADPFYRSASSRFLHGLRALRDDHKYQLSYVLLTRTPLERLRDPGDCEAFYELFSRNVLGLQPYRSVDTRRVISQLEVRKGYSVSERERELLVQASGGHPGLLVAATDALMHRKGGREVSTSIDWFWTDPGIQVECAKIWTALDEDEQWALVRVEAGSSDDDSPAQELLGLKGLIMPTADGGWQIFSPLFRLYVKYSAEQDLFDFRLDAKTASVWVAGQQVSDLTPLEWTLAELLQKHRGEVVSRDTILMALYPDEFRDGREPSLQDNRVDTLIRRLRSKVEPVPGTPRYIRTVRGHGYKLSSRSDPSEP